jgi:hypothetical protein
METCSSSSSMRNLAAKIQNSSNSSLPDPENYFYWLKPNYPENRQNRESMLFDYFGRLERPVFNIMVCPLGWSLPLGVNLASRGELCPVGGIFTPSFTPSGEHSLLFKRMEGQTVNFTPRDNFTPGVKIHSWGTTSPLGVKFAPRGEVKNGPLDWEWYDFVQKLLYTISYSKLPIFIISAAYKI